MIENKWRYKYVLPALFYAALIFFLSSLPSSAVPNLGMSLDGALAGVYLHGLSGDISKSELGEAGLLASDVLKNLPLAMRTFEAANV